MKERVVIAAEDVSVICEDCIMNENCKNKDTYEQARCCFNFQLIPANIEVEQSPETFEELKQILLDKYGDNENYVIKVNKENEDIYLDNVTRKDNSLTITNAEKGITIYDGDWLTVCNRTPKQALKIVENIMD